MNKNKFQTLRDEITEEEEQFKKETEENHEELLLLLLLLLNKKKKKNLKTQIAELFEKKTDTKRINEFLENVSKKTFEETLEILEARTKVEPKVEKNILAILGISALVMKKVNDVEFLIRRGEVRKEDVRKTYSYIEESIKSYTTSVSSIITTEVTRVTNETILTIYDDLLTVVGDKEDLENWKPLKKKYYKTWITKLDKRVRPSHKAIHGEQREGRETLFSNGCRYPCDPRGDYAEIVNCRCILGIVEKF